MTPGELIEYASVFIASALNLNYGLGLSITYELSRFELFLLLSTGSVFGVTLALLLGAKLRELWRRKFQQEEKKKKNTSMAMEVWRRYGMLGLAFLTFAIGPLPPVTIALVSGIKKELIFLYLGAGKFFWSVVFAFLGSGPIQKVLAAIIQ